MKGSRREATAAAGRHLSAYLVDRNHWRTADAFLAFERAAAGAALPRELQTRLALALTAIRTAPKPPCFPDPRSTLLRDIGYAEELERLVRSRRFRSRRAAMQHLAVKLGIKLDALKAMLLRARARW